MTCCGLRSGYMRLHSLKTFYNTILLWFAVRLYAITLYTLDTVHSAELWFAVRLYAITLNLNSIMTAR